MDHSRQTVRYLAYLILCGLGMLVGPAMAQDTLSKEDIIKMHIKQLGGERKTEVDQDGQSAIRDDPVGTGR